MFWRFNVVIRKQERTDFPWLKARIGNNVIIHLLSMYTYVMFRTVYFFNTSRQNNINLVSRASSNTVIVLFYPNCHCKYTHCAQKWISDQNLGSNKSCQCLTLCVSIFPTCRWLYIPANTSLVLNRTNSNVHSAQLCMLLWVTSCHVSLAKQDKLVKLHHHWAQLFLSGLLE